MMMQIYKDVLDGSLTLVDAKQKLQSGSVIGNIEIFVTPVIIKNMLGKYLTNEIDAEKLSDWAGFLVSNSFDIYTTPGWEDDNQADKYEPMWYVLQQLWTLFIDGQITKDRVESYIDELLKLE